MITTPELIIANSNVTINEFDDAEDADKLHHIFDALLSINAQLETIMADLTALQAAVTNEDTVIQSVLTLIQGLAAQIAALPVQQSAIDALAADVGNQATALAAAVTANTPATPPVSGTPSV